VQDRFVTGKRETTSQKQKKESRKKMKKKVAPKQIVKVVLYSDEPNAVLVCKTPSARTTGTMSYKGESARLNARTKGNYMHIDVHVNIELPTPIYTNASLVNFAKRHVDHNLDERVVLFTNEEWNKYHQVNFSIELFLYASLFGPFFLLFGWPTSDRLTTPFKWARQHMKGNIASRHDLKFVMVKEKEYEEEAFDSSNNHRPSAMTSTVEVTKKRNPDGSITVTKTVKQASAKPTTVNSRNGEF
jgi:hypothetical protein